MKNKVEEKVEVQPLREYEAVLIGTAFGELMTEEYEAMQAEGPTAEEQELLRDAEATIPKTLALIARHIRRRNTLAASWAQCGPVFRAAAILLLAVLLGFGTALAFNGGLRAKVAEFLTELTDEYVEVGFEEDAGLAVPEGWTAGYYPTYMPEGYELKSARSTSMLSYAEYRNAETDECIQMSVGDSHADLYINNQDAKYEVVNINGIDAISWKLENWFYIVWREGDHHFSVLAPTDTIGIAVARSFAEIKASE